MSESRTNNLTPNQASDQTSSDPTTDQTSDQTREASPRRSFLTGLNAGAASLAVLAAAGIAKGQSAASSGWAPARHAQDEWMEENSAQHRFLMDTTGAAGFSDALLYAGNFMLVQRNDYGLENSDSAVIVVARHNSTVFAYSDAMWAKYGAAWVSALPAQPEETPANNIYGRRMVGLADQGVQFAVCAMASRRFAGLAAQQAGGDANEVFEELTQNLVTNGRMVPAGIVAVHRAQERGYSVVNV